MNYRYDKLYHQTNFERIIHSSRSLSLKRCSLRISIISWVPPKTLYIHTLHNTNESVFRCTLNQLPIAASESIFSAGLNRRKLNLYMSKEFIQLKIIYEARNYLHVRFLIFIHCRNIFLNYNTIFD